MIDKVCGVCTRIGRRISLGGILVQHRGIQNGAHPSWFIRMLDEVAGRSAFGCWILVRGLLRLLLVNYLLISQLIAAWLIMHKVSRISTFRLWGWNMLRR